MERENQFLEFKQDHTKTYLKTVSAFANFRGGEIRFGVKDDGSILPIKDPQAFALDIENQINDSISPQPLYKIALNANNIVSLFVEKGADTPYLYNGKAYKRSSTATIEVDNYELKRLVLEGKNISFDSLPCEKENLNFKTLTNSLNAKLGISEFDESILKTIGLLTKDGLNNAALLLSDENTLNGLDIAVFGKNINVFKERINLSNLSIISQFEKAMEIFDRYYVEERVESDYRHRFERIPKVAFREILLNAIVHRDYLIKGNSKVSMYEDRIIISSPGGLPAGINEDQYSLGLFSVFRNPIIVNVFHRLGLVESFATGIIRTNIAYQAFDIKPRLEVFENAIQVILPTVEDRFFLTNEEEYFLSLLDSNFMYSREKLEDITGFNKPKLIRVLNALIEKKYIRKIGQGKSTLYCK